MRAPDPRGPVQATADRFRWERLIELAAIAGARLWLVVHCPSLSRAQREAARDWEMVVLPWE